ncbi:MAG: hypothetical protein LC798_12210 [Chloroflexi bacterium]|nr:hypothetical protein [Chloroflexota bacterium]
MTAERIFEVPAVRGADLAAAAEAPVKFTAGEVKAALRKHHPGASAGRIVGQWTCIEEWRNIDVLALNAWKQADVIGYEVKVTRSDLRHELLRPDKRADAVAMTTEFYFAVPAGMLSAAEIAWEEPEWQPGDFRRVTCPGVPEFGGPAYPGARHERWGGRCSRLVREYKVPAPIPEVIALEGWQRRRDENEDEAIERYLQDSYRHRVRCWACGGRGYLERSRVEREAPTLWVPRDAGLVMVGRRGCSVIKASPKRRDPVPLAATRRELNDLARWVSHRPDPRHATPVAVA